MRKCSVASIPGQVIDSRIAATASRPKFPLPVSRSHPSLSTRSSTINALRTNADSPKASSGRSAASLSVRFAADGSARSASTLSGSRSLHTGSTPPGHSERSVLIAVSATDHTSRVRP